MNIGKTGTAGEICAASYLKRKGYKIVARNYQTRYGEIDVIAAKGDYIIFAEVKTRSRNPLISASLSVTAGKINKIRAAAQLYLVENQCDLQPRFDYIGIELDKGTYTVAEYIENAF